MKPRASYAVLTQRIRGLLLTLTDSVDLNSYPLSDHAKNTRKIRDIRNKKGSKKGSKKGMRSMKVKMITILPIIDLSILTGGSVASASVASKSVVPL